MPSPRAQAALDRAAAAFGALRRAYAHALDTVHQLEVADVAAECGYPSTSRLLHDQVRLDRGEITVLRRHARLTHPTPQPSGHQTPPALPATAAALGRGTISDGHVRVIASTITHLAGVAHVDTDTLEITETELAGLARDRTPAGLAEAAAEICARLDPDGTVPDDDTVPVDELRWLRRRDGSLHGKFHFRDPVSAEAVHTALHAATPPVSADDDPTATDQPAGSGAAGFADPDALGARPIEQRRAQALRDLCATTLTRGHTLDIQPDEDPDPDTDGHGDGDGFEPHVELYRPAGTCDIDDLHSTTAADAADRAVTAAAATVADRAVTSDAGTGLAAETAPLLDDPAGLDSLLEHTIRALLDQPVPKPRTKRGTRRSRSEPVEGGERIHLAATIDYDTLRASITDRTGRPRLPGLGHLGSGTKISPETARRLACDADLIPIVLGSRSHPLDIGRKTRVVTPAIRRAVVARDRHCAFPGCRRRPTACDAHHLDHWITGGVTAVENLCLLCTFHHTLIHHSSWTATMINGLPWFTPPYWLDRQQRPRHNRPWQTDPTPPTQREPAYRASSGVQ